ncbi:timeless-domain-containing protein [Anaeromyces robustus]|uniref:Timeless-domain-containing protein n=1 Tax=Anaeromyces robustus TaxID=1754192 RepID=A0A1Y1W6Z4_9FUNG|nr:timeless-domain-containing protein [Anaeromyces robustus]|eukprot:ORX69320.1 timeless-domain-containing protein [Anaeromyces robustus]
MDKMYEAHLLSVCSALGGFESIESGNGEIGKKYVIGDECYDCLKDLKKFLRQDDSNVEKHVSRSLGSWMIVQKDLIPILVEYKHDDKIAMAVVEVLVPLTWPIELTVEEIKTKNQDFPSQLEYLAAYKEAIISSDALDSLFELIIKPLSIPFRERNYKETALIRLIFTLIRNLLCIKDKEASVLTSTDKLRRSTLQERLVVKLQKSHFIELLLSFAGSLDETEYVEWNLLILEIFYYMFLGRDPEEILSSKNIGLSKKVTELLQKEQRMHNIDLRKKYSRHSRFGGSFAIELDNGKKLNVIQNNAINLTMDEILDHNKKNKPKIIKNDEKYLYTKRITDEKARTIFKSTVNSFIENCFNTFYISIKKDFDMQRTKVREKDYIRFIWMLSFILKYRIYAYEKASEEEKIKFSFDSINSILNVKGLLFIVYRLKLYQDEKKWQEIGLTLYCLKYVLITLDNMNDSNDENYKEASKNLQHNLYYEEETLNIIISLCRNYKTRNSNKHFLRNLIETIHILLKMLEKFSEENKYLYTRKQKTIKKKNDGDESNTADDEEIIQKKYYEHEFHFSNVEQRFASDSIINTYLYCLEDYQTLKESTIHQITKMFYRIAIKCGLEPMFYKLSVLELFNRILSHKEILPNSQAFKELYEFINYIVNSFFIYLEKDPMLSISILFQKSKKDCLEIKYGSEYYETTKKQAEKKFDSDDEIEVKANLSWNEKLSVAVSLLKENKKEEYLKWIKDILNKAASTRDVINYKNNEDEQSKTEKQENVDFIIEPENELQKNIIEKDQQLRLLMNLLGFKEIKEFESSENEDSNELIEKNVWIIPKEFTRYKLLETYELIIHYENDPIELLNKQPASKMIKKVKKRGQRKRITNKNTDNKNKGKGDIVITDLSAPYILDEKDNISEEDSDDEAFNAFLKREAELRQRTSEKHEKQIEEENEKRSQALLKREKILKNIESKIKNKKLSKTRNKQSSNSIDSNNNNDNTNDNTNKETIEINEDEDNIIQPRKSTRKRLLRRNEIHILDEDDNYDSDNQLEKSSNDTEVLTSPINNKNIGIAFESESDSESDSEFIFKANALTASLTKEKELPPPKFIPFNLDDELNNNSIPNENINNININEPISNKRKIDEAKDIKELENNIENIQLNSKKRKKVLIVESDSESD